MLRDARRSVRAPRCDRRGGGEHHRERPAGQRERRPRRAEADRDLDAADRERRRPDGRRDRALGTSGPRTIQGSDHGREPPQARGGPQPRVRCTSERARGDSARRASPASRERAHADGCPSTRRRPLKHLGERHPPIGERAEGGARAARRRRAGRPPRAHAAPQADRGRAPVPPRAPTTATGAPPSNTAPGRARRPASAPRRVADRAEPGDRAEREQQPGDARGDRRQRRWPAPPR